MNEIWMPIIGEDGRYEVSNLGKVRSLRFVNKQADVPRKNPLVLRQFMRTGYMSVQLSGHKSHLVSRLVLRAFVGESPEGYEAAHIDGDRKNNSLSNLRWATKEENEADKITHKTAIRGQDMHNSKLSDDDVAYIRSAYVPYSKKANSTVLAAAFGVTAAHIQKIVSGASRRNPSIRAESAEARLEGE